MSDEFQASSRSWLTPPVAILIGAALIAGSILYIGSGKGTPAPDTSGTGAAAAPTPVANPDELVSPDDPVLGDANAPVTIVEFSDFQCPYCRLFWHETFSQLKSEYIDTGKAKLVFRDFPLTSIHPSAQIAAIGGQCAEAQGKFWDYHDTVFDQQMKREADPNTVSTTISFTADDLKSWARIAGLDGAAFDACLDAGDYADRVQADQSVGAAAGVDGTPTFYINGIPLVGALPFDSFKQVIDPLL